MISATRTVRVAIAAALILTCVSNARQAGAAGASRDHVACMDSSSPSYAVDAKIVTMLGKFGDPLQPFVFDGSSGVSERYFRYLSSNKCGLIMGFPVDVVSPDPPDGLALTTAYLNTAYVVVAREPISQATLKPDMKIAVGMATAPHFYLAGALGPVPNYTVNTFQTQEQTLDALANHSVDVAMAWEPSVVKYMENHPTARSWHVTPLHIQHGRWKIAALYAESDGAEAARFDAALGRLEKSGDLINVLKPYTVVIP